MDDFSLVSISVVKDSLTTEIDGKKYSRKGAKAQREGGCLILYLSAFFVEKIVSFFASCIPKECFASSLAIFFNLSPQFCGAGYKAAETPRKKVLPLCYFPTLRDPLFSRSCAKIYSLQFLNHNRRSTAAAIADTCYANVSALFVKYGAQSADYPGSRSS